MAKLLSSNPESLKELLDTLEQKYNNPSFIANDPISIPHLFDKQEDIEIAALLVSIIAWGNRKIIIRNGLSMMDRLNNSPSDFLLNASPAQIRRAASGFVHRTLNEDDFAEILTLLQRFLHKHSSLGAFFELNYLTNLDLRITLADFRSDFFLDSTVPRATRHISSIASGSACKRLAMFLRWLVRSDDRGVDFGLWRSIPPSALYIPLDVHSARQGRALNLLVRKANDWRAVEELTNSLRLLDNLDPVRYDFALFGYGVSV